MKHFAWYLVILLSLTVINYPNPVNPKGGQPVTFECTTDSTTSAQLLIYDLTARLIYQNNVSLTGGTTTKTSWSGYNLNNELVGTGVYLYRLISAANKQTLTRGKIWVINR